MLNALLLARLMVAVMDTQYDLDMNSFAADLQNSSLLARGTLAPTAGRRARLPGCTL